MIRVIHMIGSLNIGGSQTMIMNLYRKIDKEQIQFDFVIDHPNDLYFADEVKSMGGKIFVLPTFRGTNIRQIKKSWNQFFIDHPEYKILHSHVRSYASLYIPIAKKHGLKTIIHSHSTANGHGLSSIVKRVMQYPLRYQADCFFGCSKEASIWLFGKKVVASDRHVILKNAIDTQKYQFQESVRQKYREKLKLGDKRTYIHVGRFHSAKNHEFLLNLFSELHKQQPHSVLVLVGDGELRLAIEAQIQKLGLEQDVKLLGARNDIPQLLQAADVFLFPSLYEGLGIVAIEAQAAGLPTFCSDVIPREVAVSELCSFLPLDNPSVWAERILSFDLMRKDCSDNIIEAGYDIKSTAQWLENFYLQIDK